MQTPHGLIEMRRFLQVVSMNMHHKKSKSLIAELIKQENSQNLFLIKILLIYLNNVTIFVLRGARLQNIANSFTFRQLRNESNMHRGDKT